MADNTDISTTELAQPIEASVEQTISIEDNITQPSAEETPAQDYIQPKEESDGSQNEEAQDGEENGEGNEDTPKEIKTAVYEEESWQNKVEEFFEKYPVAKGFASMIGEQIVGDEQLSHDANCLEKALARVFDKVYVPPKELVKNQEFLEKYVYQDENIKNAIIERYLQDLENTRPPKSISSRGKITLTPPDRPKSIAEAGNVIKSMLNNRRI